MPTYNYACKYCAALAIEKLGRELTEDEAAEFLFETQHAMFPSEKELTEATRCPDCGRTDTAMVIDISGQVTFIRGHDWEEFKKKNKSALRRDMALHQLKHDDPYGYMRDGDDKDELADKLKAGATEKSKPKYFTGASRRS